MAITAAEQFGIELLNRARLDPAGEAARYGLQLGAGIPAGDINARQKQVLAPNDDLGTSATRHSNWMLDTDTFSHNGGGGSDPEMRMDRAGYAKPNTYDWAENIAYDPAGRGASAIAYHHGQFMRSAGHREHIMGDEYREIGLSQEIGRYGNSTGSMTTQNYGHLYSRVFVTGVAYHDKSRNDFYSVGEGEGGVTFRQVGHRQTSTGDAGGYSLLADAGSKVQIRIVDDGAVTNVIVDMIDRFRAVPDYSHMNVKLDLVDGHTVLASSNLTLVSGAVTDARLLGINGFDLTGSGRANELVGNSGNNRIAGQDGNDTLDGMKGGDNLSGNAGNDRIAGGAGNDRLQGGSGSDRLNGGAGADDFVFGRGAGSDHVIDFKGGEGDELLLNRDLWSGELSLQAIENRFADKNSDGDVVLDFGNGTVITLEGWGFLSKLDSYIEII